MGALPSLAEAKREIREKTRSRLMAALSVGSKDEWDAAICRRVEEVLAQTQGPIALFHPLADEPNLLPLDSGSRVVAFPRMNGSELEFITSAAGWKAGRFGVNEPHGGDAANVQALGAVLVPGVAFDRKGARLGRGQGYYDRALKGFKGKKVGVAYSAQIVDKPLPLEAHDVTMDYVVSEKFILKVKG